MRLSPTHMHAYWCSKASSAASVEPIVEPLRVASSRISAWLAVSTRSSKRAFRSGEPNTDRLQVLDDAGARNLAGVMAAHAVGDDEQAALGFDEVAVFIEFAQQADMALPVAVDIEDMSHCRPRSRCG